MIVAPITKPGQADGLSELQVWLPEGVWTDFFTGEIYRVKKGGRTFTAVRPLDSIPVFIRAGSVIPLSCDAGNGCGNPRALEARIYNGNGEYELFEDTDAGEAFTKFRLRNRGNTQIVTISVEGNHAVIPFDRSLKLTFPNIIIHHPADQAMGFQRAEAEITILKNGIPCEASVRAYAEVSVLIEEFDPASIYEIRVTAEPLSPLEEASRSVIAKLQRTPGAFALRDKLLKTLLRAKSIDSLANRVLLSDVKDSEKARLIESIFND